MPADSDRRQSVRATLPVKLWFNILASREAFQRNPTMADKTMELIDTPPEIKGRDELERFLLRLDQKLDIVLTLLTDQLCDLEYDYEGQVVDLSEAGLGFITGEDVPVGSYLEMTTILPFYSRRPLRIAGKVMWVRVCENTDCDEDIKKVGVQYVDIMPQDQDEIVHWIFQAQREEIRRHRQRDVPNSEA